MMQPLAVDHFVIAVSDPTVSNAFYREVIGAEVIELPRGRFAYRLRGVQLNVHTPDSRAQPLPRRRVEPGNSDLCFVWEGSIEEAVEHLSRCSVPIVEGPVERQGSRGRGTSVYFKDPDGSLLEFIAYG